MIYWTEEGETEEESLLQRVREFFAAEGALAEAAQRAGFTYEVRPQQQEMAEAVARILAAGGHLAVEAGTGVGKSLAYLVPSAFIAEEAENRPIVIGTYTISLQEQLINKDIPLLEEALGHPLRAVLAKGRNNYICHRRLQAAIRDQEQLLPEMRRPELERILRWLDGAQEGSLQEMGFRPSEEVWDLICCEQDNCLGKRCRFYRQCFFMKARQQMYSAELLIVNHHLFFADLALRGSGAGFLPEYHTVILDEAHQIDKVAAEYFGLRISRAALEYWCSRLVSQDEDRGLLAKLRQGKLVSEVRQLRPAIRELFEAITRELELGGERLYRRVMEPLETQDTVSHRIQSLSRDLLELAERIEPDDEETAAEVRAVALRGRILGVAVSEFFNLSDSDRVYWVELEGRRLQPVLYAVPIEIGPVLREVFFAQVERIVLSSATLSVAGSLDYFTRKIGAEDIETLIVGSPFRYAEQMRLLVVRGLPDPGEDEEKFTAMAAESVLPLLRKEEGGAFILFTSARMMRRFASLVGEEIVQSGRRLLIQGEDLGRDAMLQCFRREGNAVLFGLDSFWMGVDVQGPALSMVVIVRLPFSVPDQPPIRALMERIRQRGGDPFREYSLPEAVLKFRQGVGRLIRSAYDEGLVVVLDSRIIEKWYGRFFLGSIPECRVEVRDVSQLRDSGTR